MQLDISNIDPEKAAVIETLLPPTAKELVRIVGLEATLAIIKICGGTEIRFPAKGRAGNEDFQLIEEEIGKANADALRQHYSGCELVYIPICQRAMIALRNIEIIRAFDEKLKTKSCRRATVELAREYRLCNRAIEIIANGGFAKISYKKK